MRTQLVDGLLIDLLQDVRFLRVYRIHKNAQVVTNLFTSCRQVVFALPVPRLPVVVTSLDKAVNNL